MTKQVDYYTIIQVDPGADGEVIDAAYRRLAAKYHPDRDRSPGATERMVRLNAAYEVLSNPEKRRAYDESRNGSDFGGPREAAQEMVKRQVSSWVATMAISVVMLVLATGLSRFGARMIVPVILLGLLFLLLMMRRRG